MVNRRQLLKIATYGLAYSLLPFKLNKPYFTIPDPSLSETCWEQCESISFNLDIGWTQHIWAAGDTVIITDGDITEYFIVNNKLQLETT